jgi:hypothetical protein
LLDDEELEEPDETAPVLLILSTSHSAWAIRDQLTSEGGDLETETQTKRGAHVSEGRKTSCMTWLASFALNTPLSSGARRTAVKEDEIVASETVRGCFVGFLAFLGADTRDFPNWRREVRDLGCGRRKGRGRTHLFTLRPAMAIGVAFLPGVPAEVIAIRNTDSCD